MIDYTNYNFDADMRFTERHLIDTQLDSIAWNHCSEFLRTPMSPIYKQLPGYLRVNWLKMGLQSNPKLLPTDYENL